MDTVGWPRGPIVQQCYTDPDTDGVAHTDTVTDGIAHSWSSWDADSLLDDEHDQPPVERASCRAISLQLLRPERWASEQRAHVPLRCRSRFDGNESCQLITDRGHVVRIPLRSIESCVVASVLRCCLEIRWIDEVSAAHVLEVSPCTRSLAVLHTWVDSLTNYLRLRSELVDPPTSAAVSEDPCIRGHRSWGVVAPYVASLCV